MDEGVERWLENGGATEFGFDEFERGDLFCTEKGNSI